MSETLADIIEAKAEAKRSIRRRVITVVTIVALISLSVLSAFLYLRMDDYYDAKYRSQNVIMYDIMGCVFLISSYLPTVANTSVSLTERALAGTSAMDELRHLSTLVNAIREMYLEDSEKNATFALLDRAVNAVSGHLLIVHVFLVWNVTDGRTMLESPDVNAKLLSVAPVMMELYYAIDAGFKPDVDFEKHPYSVVGNLDLELIRSIADSIISSF